MIAPVEAFKAVPSGKVIGVSEVTLQVYEPVPPVAVSVAEYDSYSVPPGRVAGLVMEGRLVAVAARAISKPRNTPRITLFLRNRCIQLNPGLNRNLATYSFVVDELTGF